MRKLDPTVINSKKDFSILCPGNIPSLLQQLKRSSIFDRTIAIAWAIAWPIDDLANLAQAIFATNGGEFKIIPNPIASADTMEC